jgi:hypothetical protein
MVRCAGRTDLRALFKEHSMQERKALHEALWLISLVMGMTGMLLLSVGLDVL